MFEIEKYGKVTSQRIINRNPEQDRRGVLWKMKEQPKNLEIPMLIIKTPRVELENQPNKSMREKNY